MNRRTIIATAALLVTTAASARWRHKKHHDEPLAQAPKQPEPWPPQAKNETTGQGNEFTKLDKAQLAEKIADIWLPMLDAINDGKVDSGMLNNTLARDTLRKDLAKMLQILR